MNRESEKDEFDNIFYAVSRKSDTTPQYVAPSEIMNTVRSKSPIRLSWTHYRIILQEPTEKGRAWYENEAAKEMWSTRTLQRNVSSQYYHRLLQSQDKSIVHDEMVQLTKPLQDKLEYLKNPVVAEFLGFKNNTNYSESDLEQSIIDHLIFFLMELGKGFAFVDRQKHIHTEKEDYYIDLEKQLGAAAQQTKVRHTSPDKIKDCTVWISDLPIQEKIGRILSDIDSKIALNRAINQNLWKIAKYNF